MAPMTELDQYVAAQIEEYGGVMVPVRASLLERMFKTHVPISKLHPNPQDEFCQPSVGPNYSIITEYERLYRNYGKATSKLNSDEPLLVEKVHPDGYVILNGHHRWAAAMRSNIKKLPVQIVNLTQETDVRKMLEMSRHDKRVTFDLDEVIFSEDPNLPAEKPLGFPYKRLKESIRVGAPALMHFLSINGYDVWVYTAKYYSFSYIRWYFRGYSVKLDGVITGTDRKMKDRAGAAKRTRELFDAKYKETIHIDSSSVVRTFHDSKGFEEFPLDCTYEGWSTAAMNIIKRWIEDEKEQ